MNRFITALLTLVILSIYGCKNPADDITINVNTSGLFKSPLLVHFDNSGGAPLGNFEVNISGEDSSLVQMGTGGNDYKAIEGMMSLALKSEAKPTEENPIIFVVNAEISGYANVQKTIVITTDSSLIYRIPLSRYVKPAEGTSVLENETIIRHGVVMETFSLSTAVNAKLAQTATVTFKKGTEVFDVNKKIIDANVLKSTLTLYGLSSSSLAAAFPNGLTDINGVGTDGNLIPGGVSYTTVGLLKTVLSATETPVRHFSQPLEVVQQL